jgi:hypothetical protein
VNVEQGCPSQQAQDDPAATPFELAQHMVNADPAGDPGEPSSHAGQNIGVERMTDYGGGPFPAKDADQGDQSEQRACHARFAVTEVLVALLLECVRLAIQEDDRSSHPPGGKILG